MAGPRVPGFGNKNYDNSGVLSADRIQNSFDKVQNSTDALDDVFDELESQINSFNFTVQALQANSSFLPAPGDFSSTPSQNTVGVAVDDLGPAESDPLANTLFNASSNTILSVPFTANNVANTDYHYTVTADSNNSVDVCMWLSTTPGGNTISYNTYIASEAAGVKIEPGEEATIKVVMDDDAFANSEHIYTHWQMVLSETYYLNITGNRFGNFQGSRCVNDRQIKAGTANVSVIISGGSV